MLVELKSSDGPVWVNPKLVIQIQPCERMPLAAVPDACIVQTFGDEGRLMIHGTAAEIAAKLNEAEANHRSRGAGDAGYVDWSS